MPTPYACTGCGGPTVKRVCGTCLGRVPVPLSWREVWAPGFGGGFDLPRVRRVATATRQRCNGGTRRVAHKPEG